MLMDDTVILATSRERLIQKLSLLQECCQNAGMVINEKKTEFMAINGTEEEKDPIFLPLCGCNMEIHLFRSCFYIRRQNIICHKRACERQDQTFQQATMFSQGK